MVRYKDKGTVTSSNVDEFFNSSTLFTRYNDFYLGDYFKIEDGKYNGIWKVCGFSCYKNTGVSTNIVTADHMVLMPKTHLPRIGPWLPDEQVYTSNLPMNSTDTAGVSKNPLNPLYETTQGEEMAGYQGYYGCDMNQIYLPEISAQLKNALVGSRNHMINFSGLLSCTIDFERETNIWYQNKYFKGIVKEYTTSVFDILLPSFVEIYGYNPFGESSFYDEGITSEKLPIYNFVYKNFSGMSNMPVRNIVGNARFGRCGHYGYATHSPASLAYTISPIICII